MRKDFEEIQRKEDEALNGLLKVTSRMFRTVFAEIKMNIPFYSHPKMVELHKTNGLDMGIHHYDKTAATKMMSCMSAHMHRLLLQHMVSQNLPFSIIIDGSSDKTDIHYLIIYFQILENNIPSVVFYRLIQTSSDVTALGYFNSIINAIKSEEVDLHTYMRNNLIGYISDGENTMTGETSGLISHFRKIAKKHIFPVHCMAHRMHLAIGNAYASIPYFTTFDKLINNLFKFYNKHAYKKKMHLKDRGKIKYYFL